MTILLHNLKRIFKNKLRFFVIALMPALILYLVSSSIFSGPNQKLILGIADLDRTEFTMRLINKLSLSANIKPIAEEQIDNNLFNSKIDYAIVLEKGFTEKLLQGEDVKARGYYVKNAGQVLLVQKFIDNAIVSAKKIAQASGESKQKYYQILNRSDPAQIQLDHRIIPSIQRQKSYYILGAVLEILLLSTLMFTTMMQNDKANKTFVRTLSAPVSLRCCLLQTILGFLLVAVIQVSIMLFVLKRILHIYTGNSSLMLVLLFLSACVLAVSLGTAVNSLSQNMLQASFTGVFIGILFTTLGGCLWEHDMVTAPLRNIGKFTPAYWIMDGVGRLLNEQGFWAVGGDILLVLGFSFVFLLLGSWKKEDVAS